MECNLFWWHLRLAGFVPGAVSGIGSGIQPPNAVNGIIGVQQGGLGFTSNIVCSSNMPDKIAISVDTQMDDGTPGAGEIRASQQTLPNPRCTRGQRHRLVRGDRPESIPALQESLSDRDPEKPASAGFFLSGGRM